MDMGKLKKTLVWCYAITAIFLLGYFIHVCFTIEESASIGLIFAPIYLFGLFVVLAWMETLVVGLLFFKLAREAPKPLLVAFFIAGACMGALLYWLSKPEEHAEIPQPGKLHVETVLYQEHLDTLVGLYTTTTAHVRRYYLNDVDSLFSVTTDTIIYSPHGDTLLAFVFISGSLEGALRCCNGTMAGIKSNDGWRYFVPSGNTRMTCMNSAKELRTLLLQYYYDRYSINGSDPHKPSIWVDKYLFEPDRWAFPAAK